MAEIGKARRIGRRFQNPMPTEVGGFGLALKVLPQWLLTKAERTPNEPLGPFRTDPTIYTQPPAGGLRVTWIGHSTSLVEIDGVRILLDPVWDPRASPSSLYGPKRFFAAPLALEQLPPLDVVLFSHDHYDHLGAQTARALGRLPAAARARWVTTVGVGQILREFGAPADRLVELDWTDTVRVGNLAITALPARHFSGRSFFRRNETLWASFKLAGPEHSVFYGADSGEWPGYAEVGRQWGPFDLTMLEIGAYNPLWADIHMGPDGAARTFRALNSRDPAGSALLMPVHWGLFDLALQYWREPIERLIQIEDLKLWSPEPGLPTEVTRGTQLRANWWRAKE